MLTNITEEVLFDRVVEAIRKFFENSCKKKSVIGLSGGIDSSLVAALAVEALGKENVHGLIMPSPFSTMHSVTDAVELADNLEIKYDIVPIEAIFHRFIKELESVFKAEPKRLTVENIQARIRGNLLMAYSNQNDALVLNTSNKSEIAMGYGTLYGDLSGALMVIADIYKVDVYNLSYYINSISHVIPDSILTKEPSAELSIGQKDSDTLPQYDVLDPILFSIHEKGISPEELLRSGTDAAILEKVQQLMKASSFKVHQLPPMIQVGSHPLLPQNKCITI